MVADAGKSPAVPGFRLVANFQRLYTIGYAFPVPVYAPYIPGIYKQIYGFAWRDFFFNRPHYRK